MSCLTSSPQIWMGTCSPPPLCRGAYRCVSPWLHGARKQEQQKEAICFIACLYLKPHPQQLAATKKCLRQLLSAPGAGCCLNGVLRSEICPTVHKILSPPPLESRHHSMAQAWSLGCFGMLLVAMTICLCSVVDGLCVQIICSDLQIHAPTHCPNNWSPVLVQTICQEHIFKSATWAEAHCGLVYPQCSSQ